MFGRFSMDPQWMQGRCSEDVDTRWIYFCLMFGGPWLDLRHSMDVRWIAGGCSLDVLWAFDGFSADSQGILGGLSGESRRC